MGSGPDQAQPKPEGWQPTAEGLKAYVDANYGRFTDEAITGELLRAGYAPDDIRVAIQEAARSSVAPPTRRAIGVILTAYAVTFAILSLGMLANTYRGGGCCAPDAAGGIIILAGSLGFALLISLMWVGSRRLAGVLFAILLGFYGMALLTGGSTLAGLVVIGIAVGLIALVLRRNPAPRRRSAATLGALLSVPVILLVIVAGLCVATGLPIPTSG